MSQPHDRPDIPATEFMGHPVALWQLFNIEMWERFAYYGMRAVLAPYVALTFFSHMSSGEANAEASLVYGGYTALVYATGIAGGYVADNYVDTARALGLTTGDLVTLAANAIDASFAPDEEREVLRAELSAIAASG